MRSTVGRLMPHCRHLSGWDEIGGEQRCRTCGTRRFTDYGALRPRELPSAVTPSPEDLARADRAAAIVVSRTVRHLSRWGFGAAAFWRAA
ncbi:hypothetical protein I5Q34_05485 [Streptomyces sp. AV19]|uniref:DUF6255 family natural product biosynthesis protein n=1 Tax=Streptomyces sp. AV19 TaxID=2793068 RepID=UPI0018FE2F0E|nr:DUF6255 family natural product biosynthesis protein [Streptomyces sp. AV19]MBH1933752.1 hypothetical protein [Streptomyces sp. AV19]MDG4535743.1 DUF6255 family natural product biosynthesis protein [Streptomyces sp. AV19]